MFYAPILVLMVKMAARGKESSRKTKTTWRRTVEAERRKAGRRDLSTARAVAKDREALCAYWHDK